MSVFDLNKVKFKAESPESAAERKARLLREEKVGDHDRRKDFLLFVVSLGLITITALCSLVALFLPPPTPTWASSILSLIIGGLLGYQTGKAQVARGAA